MLNIAIGSANKNALGWFSLKTLRFGNRKERDASKIHRYYNLKQTKWNTTKPKTRRYSW